MSRTSLISRLAICVLVLGLCEGLNLRCAPSIQAQEVKAEVAKITAFEPAAIVVGAKTNFKIRGFKLKDATGIRLVEGMNAVAEIKEKKDAGPAKGLENKQVGDTQVLVEIDLPADHPAGLLKYVVATPSGEVSGEVRVFAVGTIVEEVEPNNGFRESQSLPPGLTARGSIQGDKDVDVYGYVAKAGQQLKVSVTSGGVLLMDAALHCYDTKGQFLAASDDNTTRDPVATLKVPSDGLVFLCVSSAHDVGGEWHNYLLSVEEVK